MAEVAIRRINPARGRVAVDTVKSLPSGAHAMRPATGTANDDIVIQCAERPKRQRVDRRERTESPIDGQGIERRGANAALGELRVGRSRTVERRIYRRRRPDSCHLEHDALRASRLVEVVVDDRDGSATDAVWL